MLLYPRECVESRPSVKTRSCGAPGTSSAQTRLTDRLRPVRLIGSPRRHALGFTCAPYLADRRLDAGHGSEAAAWASVLLPRASSTGGQTLLLMSEMLPARKPEAGKAARPDRATLPWGVHQVVLRGRFRAPVVRRFGRPGAGPAARTRVQPGRRRALGRVSVADRAPTSRLSHSIHRPFRFPVVRGPLFVVTDRVDR
jgi:hypothetical protein